MRDVSHQRRVVSISIFFTFFSGLFVMLCLPVNAQQTEKIRRLGFLYASTVPLTGGGLAQIKEGLRELGYVEGKISHLSTGMRTGGRIS